MVCEYAVVGERRVSIPQRKIEEPPEADEGRTPCMEYITSAVRPSRRDARRKNEVDILA